MKYKQMSKSFYLPDKKSCTPRVNTIKKDSFFKIFEKNTESKYFKFSPRNTFSNTKITPKSSRAIINISDDITADSGTITSYLTN